MRTLGVVSLLLFCAMVPNHSGLSQPIKIGVAAPLSGPLASEGRGMAAGVEQAIEDLNAKGGLLGRKLQPDLRDDRCEPETAATVAKQFVADPDVALVIGHFCTNASVAASAVYAQVPERLVEILPASTAPTLTDRGYKNVFRVVPRSDRQASVVEKFLHDVSKYNVGIFFDGTNADGSVASLLKQSSPDIFSTAKYSSSDLSDQSDLNIPLSQLKSLKIEVAYVAGTPSTMARFITQARKAGSDALFVAGESAAAPSFLANAGDAAEGTLVTFIADPRVRPDAKAVIERMVKGKRTVSIYGLYAYAAAEVWAQSVNYVGTGAASAVATKLRTQTNKTIIGPLTFDVRGDVKESEYEFYQWRKRELVRMNHRPPPPPTPPGH